MFENVKDILKGIRPIGIARSSRWNAVRNNFLESHPCCEVCAGTKTLRVHHIKPYHLFPELELEETNLITLCESRRLGVNCHLFIGHLGNYKNINPDCVRDAKYWCEKLKRKEFSNELEYLMYFKSN